MKDFLGIILAAGEGTRMKSDVPKVLHNICGRPMIDYAVDSVKNLRLRKIFVVINKRQDELLNYFKKNKYVKLVFQKKALGTANAVSSAKKFLSKNKANVLVVCADVPLIKKETLQALIERHKERKSSCTILTSLLDNPFGFGRILRDAYSKVYRIVEENDANSSQRQGRS